MRRLALLTGFLLLLSACNLPRAASSPTPDLFATLQAITPAVWTPSAIATPAVSASDSPPGRIVFTCQLFHEQSREQICIMNADGTGYRRLTTDDETRHFYPSLSPDGESVLYSGFNQQNQHFELYEFDLAAGTEKRLTNYFGDLNAPEISPDGSAIVFTRFFDDPDKPTSWLMDRDGSHLRQVSPLAAWDPTWSPDGKQILFASYAGDLSQLFIINLDGTGLRQVSHLPALRGRSDWSPQNLIVTYSGRPWQRELFLMKPDGSNLRQLTPDGGNSQGPSFSPDGGWVAFTAYFDQYGDPFGCEIYVIRVDGTDLRRLTDNDYCDYQPRWGP